MTMSFVEWLVGPEEASHYDQSGCFWDNPQRLLPWLVLAFLITLVALIPSKEK